MVREKSKKIKKEKTLGQVVMEYVRTIMISFSVALVFTLLLSLHARSEMIKNFYANAAERQNMNEQLAKQLIMQSDFIADLKKKNYAICVQVGNLYESAHEYQNAQLAYELAISKMQKMNYAVYYKLSKVLIAQGKIDEAKKLLNSIDDVSEKNLIKFKTRAYIEMGDKYYSLGKFLSAAKSYEKAKFYYDKFSKKDKVIDNSIKDRIVNAYIETADVLVKNGMNTEAVRFLKKAEKYSLENFEIKYKLAIIYSDLEPIKAVIYFEPLMHKIPQKIDADVYAKALMKAANISEWEGKPARAKYYRYKIHSVDIFVDNKVVYKNDFETYLDKFVVRKLWFAYRLNAVYRFKNVSHKNITNLSASFVLRQGDKVLEMVTVRCVDKNSPLYSNNGVTDEIKVKFRKNIFTKNELEQYVIDIYLFKDEKYKTLVNTMKVPLKTLSSTDGERALSLIEF